MTQSLFQFIRRILRLDACDAREALELAADLLRQEGYDRDPDYAQEWRTITEALT